MEDDFNDRINSQTKSQSTMKILFVTPPPYIPNRLHRMRSFDLIKILSKKHEVHLLPVTTEKK